jgi:hypothetical protein
LGLFRVIQELPEGAAALVEGVVDLLQECAFLPYGPSIIALGTGVHLLRQRPA